MISKSSLLLLAALASCAADQTFSFKPTADSPCGEHCVVCARSPLAWCSEHEVCGGGPWGGCPAGACCWAGTSDDGRAAARPPHPQYR